MTAMRVERQSAGSYVAKPESGSWQSFDVQLAFYALALAVIGLLMAWTNSTGGPLGRRLDVHARTDVVRGRDLRVHPRRGLRLSLAAHLLVAAVPGEHRAAAADDGHRRRRSTARSAGYQSPA